MSDDRPTWHEYFLAVADVVSIRADCRRRRVGAIVVSPEHRIIGTGYNGVRTGSEGCLQGACPRGLLSYDQIAEFSDYSDPKSPGYCISTHAEENAKQQAGLGCHGATMYVTCQPCPACFKAIRNSGLDFLIYRDRGIVVVDLTEAQTLPSR